MPTLLYALTLPGEPVSASARGVAREPVRTLPCGPVTAVVGTVEKKPSPTLETVQAHDEVLRSCVDAGATVAAVRFGQLFADDATCERDVRERGERVAKLLEEYRGCVEMRVLAKPPIEEPEPSRDVGPGRAYLESLRSGPPSGASLAPALGSLIRAERVETTTSAGKVRGVAYAHLVDRSQVDAYRAAVRSALPEGRVVGPLALHAFAEPVA